MSLQQGTRLDRYTLLEPIAEGGQGAVWKAHDPLESDAPKALKLLSLGPARRVDLERIRREARALAALDHPSLVGCHGLFEDLKFDVLGLVMDYVDGASLRSVLDAPRFSERARVVVLGHIADALAYVHERGIVHRDIKLDNVLITTKFWDTPEKSETVKLVDFGIAATHGNPQPLTDMGSVIGTPPFMPPELIDPTFHSGGKTSAAADVFAFGILGWKLLVGEHPTGLPESSKIIEFALKYREIARGGWPPRKLDNLWGEILERCYAVRVDDRLRDAREIVRCLQDGCVPERASLPRTLDDVPASRAPGATRYDGANAERALPRTVPQGPAFFDSSPSSPSHSPPIVRATPRPPMESHPSDPRSSLSAAAVSEDAPTMRRPRQRRRRWLGAMLVITVMGAMVALLAFAGATGGFPEPDLDALPFEIPGQTRQARPPSPTTKVVPRPDPEPPTTSTPIAPSLARTTCCPARTNCAVDTCSGSVEPGDRFALRLAGARESLHEDLFKYHPYAQICMRIAGSGARLVCTELAAIRGRNAPKTHLATTGEDLLTHGVEIQVHDPPGTPRARKIVRIAKGIKRSALCTGLISKEGFEPMGPGGSVYQVDIWLDDPDEPPPTRCK